MPRDDNPGLFVCLFGSVLVGRFFHFPICSGQIDEEKYNRLYLTLAIREKRMDTTVAQPIVAGGQTRLMIT